MIEGTWTNEGHTLEFKLNNDGTCRIYESYEASQQEMT